MEWPWHVVIDPQQSVAPRFAGHRAGGPLPMSRRPVLEERHHDGQNETVLSSFLSQPPVRT
jgi:hypothetical protein